MMKLAAQQPHTQQQQPQALLTPFTGPGATAGNNPNFTFYKGHTYLIDNTSYVLKSPFADTNF